MTPESIHVARMPVLTTFALLAALLALSVVVGERSTSSAAHVAVLALAALKVALVASEYIEIRGAARWLGIVWVFWGAATFAGLTLFVV